jgi:putative intracellular protease/amidase
METFEIGIALFDGVEELDFAGPYEVLTAWSRYPDRSVRVRTLGDGNVTCSHGLVVVPDVSWAEARPLDLLVVPGGDMRQVRTDPVRLAFIRDVAEGER